MADRVEPFADRTGARTLPWATTTAEEWRRMSPKERYRANDRELRKRINQGDKFRYIGLDPNRDPIRRERFDLTRSEILRLEERGIPYEIVPPEEVFEVLGRH